MGKSAKTVLACIVIAVFVAAGLVAYKYYSPASPSFETGKAVRQQVGKAGGAETVYWSKLYEWLIVEIQRVVTKKNGSNI